MIHERDRELAFLSGMLADLGLSGGRVVLVRGEAGIGKSALVEEFLARVADGAHVLVGACDDLLTAQPLGPVWDIARHEDTVATPLEMGERVAVREALLELCSRKLRPTVLVIEDTQWADEATLDVITFIGRRIARTNGLLILTYRDGEVDSEHPLRRVIGELPPRNVARLTLQPLSATAIATMVDGRGLDHTEILALTGGNPLFVTEVAASGVGSVPATVRDSVLARASKLSADARRALDLTAVIPGGADIGLIEIVLGTSDRTLAECARQGLLEVVESTVSYRHELQRRAIESSLSTLERQRLNRAVLDALGGSGDPARLVHHAREANDVDAVVKFAPRAARAAMRIESHTEALAHFQTLAPHLDRFDASERASILGDWGRVAFYLDDPQAPSLLHEAIEWHRRSGSDRELARLLVFTVRVDELNGRPDLADAHAEEAVRILQTGAPSRRLATALNQVAWLRLMRGDDHEAGIDAADQAIRVAETAGDEQNVVRALIVKGAIGHSSSSRTSVTFLEEGHRRAVEAGYRSEEVYALVNLGGLAADVRDVERAADFVQRARAAAARFELRYLEMQAAAMYSEILVWKGNWDLAENVATDVLGSIPHAELIAWRMLGTLQARRGSPGAKATLERMWTLAATSNELQNLDPAAGALAEYLWLTDEPGPDQIPELGDVLDRGLRSGFLWPSGAFAFWMWKLGRLPTIPDTLSEFYRWIIEGEWERAAAFWEARGVPYERGLALMHGTDEAQIEAIRVFEGLGADATASRVRRSLMARGVKVARGSGRSTRRHVAGLTARQAEVLVLLAEGLTNAEIADRLFVSPRTVENHVSALLMKLDAATRSDAVAAAHSRGLLEDQPVTPAQK